jgi:hypothetical protein
MATQKFTLFEASDTTDGSTDMKQLITTARNIRHLIHDGKTAPEIEVIIGLSERVAAMHGSDVTLLEACETVRFALVPEAARKVAATLIEYADEAEAESELLMVETKQ